MVRRVTAGCTTNRDLATFSISFLQVSLSLESTRTIGKIGAPHIGSYEYDGITGNMTVQRGI